MLPIVIGTPESRDGEGDRDANNLDHAASAAPVKALAPRSMPGA